MAVCAPSPHNFSTNEVDPAVEVRLQNLDALLSCFRFKASLAKLANSGQAQLAQAFRPRDSKTYRPLGHRLARRIEVGLGIPVFCMEIPGGVLEHLPDIVARCTAIGIEASMPGKGSKDVGQAARAPDSVRSHLVPNPPMKALHVATMDSLESALRRGAISDKECLSLMQAWTPEG